MQLVAYGAQDVYLTGNPQITFFKVVYRRHTNFSMESIKQSYTGGVGQKTWTISRNGDLILNMFLEDCNFKINQGEFGSVSGDPAGSQPKYFHEYKKCLNAYLDTIRYTIEIGGQTIDRFDNLYRRVHNSLFDKNPTCDENTLLLRMEDSGIWNLPFWFCRNPGLALPLIALQYHEVKFIMDLKKASSLGGGEDISLWVDYAYLDTDERKRFAQVSHEYLIEQVQMSQFSISEGGDVPTNKRLDINFNHPVKELIWSFKNMEGVDIHQTTTDTKTTAQLILNGQDRFAARSINYFSDLQVWKYHSGFGSLSTFDTDADFIYDIDTDVYGEGYNSSGKFHDSPVYVYSFALKPEEHQPSGTCNFSRIDSASLVLNGLLNTPTDARTQPDNCHLYAINYNVLRIMSGMGGLAYSN